MRGDVVEERQIALLAASRVIPYVSTSPPSPQPPSNLYVGMSRIRYRSMQGRTDEDVITSEHRLRGLAYEQPVTDEFLSITPPIAVGIPIAMNVVHVCHNRIPWLTAHPVGRLIDMDFAPLASEEMEMVD